jgi:lauroyl/myristoyl acyltransferase
MLKRLSFKAITALTGILPRSVQYAISRPAADLYYQFGKTARENVRANLRVILGSDVSEKLLLRETREVFRAFGKYLCEFFGANHMGPRFVDKYVVIQGREHLDTALARGRGVVFCSGHYSNWELGAMVVARHGYPITGVYQSHDDKRTNAMFVQQRADWGITIVPSQHGAKSALRALRQNQTVALMGDRLTGGPVVDVDFFGKRARLPMGPFRIALTSGAAILPTFIHRRANGQFTLEIGAPLEVGVEGTLAERSQRLGQAWAKVLETRVKIDPSQWTVFYNFWETPAGESAAHGGAPLETAQAGAAETIRQERTQ